MQSVVIVGLPAPLGVIRFVRLIVLLVIVPVITVFVFGLIVISLRACAVGTVFGLIVFEVVVFEVVVIVAFVFVGPVVVVAFALLPTSSSASVRQLPLAGADDVPVVPTLCDGFTGRTQI
jgi:hypothetical protein